MRNIVNGADVGGVGFQVRARDIGYAKGVRHIIGFAAIATCVGCVVEKFLGGEGGDLPFGEMDEGGVFVAGFVGWGGVGDKKSVDQIFHLF